MLTIGILLLCRIELTGSYVFLFSREDFGDCNLIPHHVTLCIHSLCVPHTINVGCVK